MLRGINPRFVSKSSSDTTLVVNDAVGDWHCNNDSDFAGGSNAAILIDNPLSGQYNIWVGTFSSDQALEIQTNLIITETATSNWLSLGETQPIADDEIIDDARDIVSNEITEQTETTIDQLGETEITPVQSAVQYGRKNN